MGGNWWRIRAEETTASQNGASLFSRASKKSLSSESTNTVIKSWPGMSLPRLSHEWWMTGAPESRMFTISSPTETFALRAENTSLISAKERATRCWGLIEIKESVLFLDFSKTCTYSRTSSPKSRTVHPTVNLFLFWILVRVPSFTWLGLPCLYTLKETFLCEKPVHFHDISYSMVLKVN